MYQYINFTIGKQNGKGIIVGNTTYLPINAFTLLGNPLINNGNHTYSPTNGEGIFSSVTQFNTDYLPWHLFPTIHAFPNGSGGWVFANYSETPNVVATITGNVQGDAIYLPIANAGNMLLDTGSYTLLYNQSIANALKLPNLGASTVYGVGGAAASYESKTSFSIGQMQLDNVSCIVDASYIACDGLFGFSVLAQFGLGIVLDSKAQTITFFRT